MEPCAVKLHHIHSSLLNSLKVIPLLPFLQYPQNTLGGVAYTKWQSHWIRGGTFWEKEEAVFSRGNIEFSDISGVSSLKDPASLGRFTDIRPMASCGCLFWELWLPLPWKPCWCQDITRGCSVHSGDLVLLAKEELSGEKVMFSTVSTKSWNFWFAHVGEEDFSST